MLRRGVELLCIVILRYSVHYPRSNGSCFLSSILRTSFIIRANTKPDTLSTGKHTIHREVKLGLNGPNHSIYPYSILLQLLELLCSLSFILLHLLVSISRRGTGNRDPRDVLCLESLLGDSLIGHQGNKKHFKSDLFN